jgi:hypothetical protein
MTVNFSVRPSPIVRSDVVGTHTCSDEQNLPAETTAYNLNPSRARRLVECPESLRAVRIAARHTYTRVQLNRKIGVVALAVVCVLSKISGVFGLETDSTNSIYMGAGIGVLVSVVVALVCVACVCGCMKVGAFVQSYTQDIMTKINSKVDAMDTRFEVMEANAALAITETRALIASATPVVKRADDASAAVVRVGSAAVSIWDQYCILTVALGCMALARSLYDRWSRKDENKEATIVGLKQKDVFKLFDGAILACVLPMFFTHGVAGAVNLWRFMKTISSMIRDAADCTQLFTRIFGTTTEIKDGRVTALAGIGFVNSIADVADELVGRVEEVKEAEERKLLSSPGMERVCYNCKTEGVGHPGPCEPIRYCNPCKSFSCNHCHGVPIANPVLVCMRCRTPDCEHSGKAIYSSFFVLPASLDQPDMWTPLRALWHKSEDHQRLNKLQKLVVDKPWLLPAVFIMLFASVLIVSRLWAKDEEERKPTRSETRKLKFASNKKIKILDSKRANDAIGKEIKEAINNDGCCHVSNCPLGSKKPIINSNKLCNTVCGGHNCVHWSGCCPPEEKERRTKKYQPSGNFDLPDKELNDDNEEYDEKGNLVQRAGRRATRRAAANMAKDMILIEESRFSPLRSHKKLLDSKFPSPTEGERTCTFCNTLGHSAHFCPNNCNFCKGQGHKTEDCKKMLKREIVRAAAAGNATVKESLLTEDIRSQQNKATSNKKKEEKRTEKKKVEAKEAQADSSVPVAVTKPTYAAVAGKEVKEALYFGAQFTTGAIVKSIGWAEVRTDAAVHALNCTAVWNGIYVSAHVFPKGSLGTHEIAFHYGDIVATAIRADGKLIGNDSLFFATPKGLEKVPVLRCTETKDGDKVQIVCYDSRANQAAGLFKISSGTVQKLVREPGHERAYVTYSSADSNCGSPIINEAGKCVGWHNARTASENVFIPVTKYLVGKATGSAESF